jgi:sporulation protein YlmC with PRC-barrel domain
MRRRSMVTKVTNLIGNHVRNCQGEDLGRIQELVLDADTGQIYGAIVCARDPLSGRERCSTIPWKELTLADEDEAIYVDEDVLAHPFRRQVDWSLPVDSTPRVTIYTSSSFRSITPEGDEGGR